MFQANAVHQTHKDDMADKGSPAQCAIREARVMEAQIGGGESQMTALVTIQDLSPTYYALLLQEHRTQTQGQTTIRLREAAAKEKVEVEMPRGRRMAKSQQQTTQLQAHAELATWSTKNVQFGVTPATPGTSRPTQQLRTAQEERKTGEPTTCQGSCYG